MRIISGIASIALILVTISANAESPTYLGKTLSLTPPTGYCVLGKSPSELEMQEFQRRNTAPAGELAQLAVPCDELEDFRAQRIENFSSWVHILILKSMNSGAFTLIQSPRSDFVRKIAGSFADMPPDFEGLNKRTSEHLASTGVTVNIASTQPLGATAEAFFVEMHGSVRHNSGSSPISVVMAFTTVNQLAVCLYASATPRSQGESLIETSFKYLHNVLKEN